jgi:hypothetical protein
MSETTAGTYCNNQICPNFGAYIISPSCFIKSAPNGEVNPPYSMSEQETIDETKKHISNVIHCILRVIHELAERAINHDQSKLLPPELQTFMEYTPKLATSTYGSDEYKQFLAEMKPALDHHYECNRHHPEHFKEDGVNGMNLVDLIEMLCDWKAATLRHNDGNIIKSIEFNKTRFNMSNQLTQILLNSVGLFVDE